MRHSRGVADTLTAQATIAGWPTPMAGTPAQNGNNEAGNNEAGNNDFSRKVDSVIGKTPTGIRAATESIAGFQLNPNFSLWLMLGSTWCRAWHDAGLSALHSFVAQGMPSSRK